jgi:hypothetical protein
MKPIKEMTLPECIEALHVDMEVELFDGAGEWGLSYTRLADVADRIYELYQAQAQVIEKLYDILEDRRRTAEEEHGRNMNEANL